jgi:hypothetical protein
MEHKVYHVATCTCTSQHLRNYTDMHMFALNLHVCSVIIRYPGPKGV